MSKIIANQIQHTQNGATAFTLPTSDGSTGQVMKTDGSGALSFVTATDTIGLSDFDRWYLTADLSGNTNPIVNNWSRWTGNGGTGTVTFAAPSSGIWTFPSTGYWHIDWTGKFVNSGSQERGCNLYLYGTTNGGSQAFIQEVSVSLHDSGNATKGESKITYIIDVHDTSQVKVSFAVGYQNAARTLKGHGSYLYSHVAFTKLMET
tara:strand:- start:268 stop:882 length:615 start_codon:yes stop_codon:yes gene_type:complete